MSRIVCVVLFATLACFGGAGQASPSSSSRDQIYSALIGEWTGTLEYRDFQTNERVVLPTWLEIEHSQDGASLRFSYMYDDGPSKTVTEVSTITIDPAEAQFSITSDRDHSSDSYQIVKRSGEKRVQLLLTGKGKENGKAADVRITIKVDRNLYQFTKETRIAGQGFAFRDGYTFTRRTAGR